MSVLAPSSNGADPAPAQRESVTETRERWRKRVRTAQEAQKPFWGTWATNLAFDAGQHWLVWDQRRTQLRSLAEVDSRYADRELFTADRITELRQAQLGELSSEDERPELLAAQQGEDAEQTAELLNRLAAYAWDDEWAGDQVLAKARRLVLVLGVAAVRCRWDPDQGDVVGHLPVSADGQPADQQSLEQNGYGQDGGLPRFRPVRQGRTRWDVYSAFQLLTPPGVVHEDDFPWEALCYPVSVDEVRDLYGVSVREDTDIVSTIGMPASLEGQTGQRTQNRLRDHCWLYPCFDRPSRRYPQGQTLLFAGADLQLLDLREGLPYQHNQRPHSGVVYLHWWRLADRFWSRSFIEGLKDPQRVLNRRKTQNVEIFDRGMPKLIVRQGDWPSDTTGAPLEVVELSRTAQAPTLQQGVTPSQAMYQDIAGLDDDLHRASTLSELRLGENPQNVQTYAQLALLNDNEHGKRATVQIEHQRAIATLVELSLADIKQYWPEAKTVMVAGSDDRIAEVTFRKSQIPAGVRVKVAHGQPLPRSQGAQVKKIDAVWAAMVQSGFVSGDPVAAANWYKDSLEAGSPLDLPKGSPSTQAQLAHLENMLMRQGEEVQAAYYDNIQEHLPVHRSEQDEARAMADAELASRVERHILSHNQMASQALSMAAQAAGPPGQAPPGMPPGPTGPPGQPMAPQTSPAAPGGAPAPAGGAGMGPGAVFAAQDFSGLAQGQ